MKKNFEILRKCSLFNNIVDDELDAMLGCLGAKTQKIKKGGTILSEGEPAKYIGIILSGKVQIVRMDYYGNRSIVSAFGAPHLFGEAFAFAEVNAMPVSVAAAEDTEVMLIDAKRITERCSNACGFHSRLIFNLLQIVSEKNLEFNRKIEITSKRTTREKLMTYLLLQAKQHKNSSFIIPYNRQELADYLEVERSGLSAEISKLRNEGVIKCRRSEFRLLQGL